MNVLPWMKMYPTLEAVQVADFDTLSAWAEHLPEPQRDVERTIRRRVDARMASIAGAALRDANPKLADKLNSVMNEVERVLGVKVPFRT